jgi:hypothetical protein
MSIPESTQREAVNRENHQRLLIFAQQKVVEDGVTPEEAQTKYVELVEVLKNTYGFDSTKVPEAVGGA